MISRTCHMSCFLRFEHVSERLFASSRTGNVHWLSHKKFQGKDPEPHQFDIIHCTRLCPFTSQIRWTYWRISIVSPFLSALLPWEPGISNRSAAVVEAEKNISGAWGQLQLRRWMAEAKVKIHGAICHVNPYGQHIQYSWMMQMYASLNISFFLAFVVASKSQFWSNLNIWTRTLKL